MLKKKKYPKIRPYTIADKGKTVEIYLNYKVYKSMIDEMDDLKKSIAGLKKRKQQKTRFTAV